MIIRNKMKFTKGKTAERVANHAWLILAFLFFGFAILFPIKVRAQASPLVMSIEAAEQAMKPATVGPDQKLPPEIAKHRSNAAMAASEGDSGTAMKENQEADKKQDEFDKQRQDSEQSQNIVQNLQAKKGMAMAMQSNNAAAVNAARQAMASSNPLQMQQNCQAFNSVAKDKSQMESEFHTQVASEHEQNVTKFKSKRWMGEINAPSLVQKGVAAIQAAKALHDTGTGEMAKSTGGCGENGMNLGSLTDILGKVAGMAGGGGGKGGGKGGGEPSAPTSSPLASTSGERVDISNGGAGSTVGIGGDAPETGAAPEVGTSDTSFNAAAPTPISDSQNNFAASSLDGAGSHGKSGGSGIGGTASLGGLNKSGGGDGSTAGASQAPGASATAAASSTDSDSDSHSSGSFGGGNSGLLGLTETPLPDFANSLKPEENGKNSVDFANSGGREPASGKNQNYKTVNLAALQGSLFYRTSDKIRASWRRGNIGR